MAYSLLCHGLFIAAYLNTVCHPFVHSHWYLVHLHLLHHCPAPFSTITLLCSTNNPQRNIRRHSAQLLQHHQSASQLVHFLLQLVDEVVRLLVVRRRARSLPLHCQLPQHVLKIVIHLNRHLKLLLPQLLPQLQQLLAPRQSLLSHAFLSPTWKGFLNITMF